VRVGLDTSVVVRLLTGEPAAAAARAAERVEAVRTAGGQIVVSDLVVAEAYFALQHHYGLTKAEALDDLRELFRASPLRSSGAAERILRLAGLATANPGFVDRLIHADYAREADEIWTFERAGTRLASVRLVGT